MYSLSHHLFNIHHFKLDTSLKHVNQSTSVLKIKIMKLFTASEYQKLINEELDILKLLSDKGYNLDITHDKESLFFSLENHFYQEIKTLVESIEEVYSKKKIRALKHFILSAYDLLNLKILYKNWAQKNDFNSIGMYYFGFEGRDFFYQLYTEQLKEKAYPPILKQYIERFYQNHDILNDVYQIDITWDHYLQEFLQKIINQLHSECIQQFFMLQTDIKNLLMLFRIKGVQGDFSDLKLFYLQRGSISYKTLAHLFKKEMQDIVLSLTYLSYYQEIKQGIEYYETYQNFSELNKLLHQYENKLLIQMARATQGLELLVIYFWLKKQEIENIRMILSSKWNNMDHHWILNKIRTIK